MIYDVPFHFMMSDLVFLVLIMKFPVPSFLVIYLVLQKRRGEKENAGKSNGNVSYSDSDGVLPAY
jgi:hypothetical protein